MLVLPIDRCPLRNESLGFCRLSVPTGSTKSLADAQSTLRGWVSVRSHGAGVASYLCLLSRLRQAVTLTSPDTSIFSQLGLGRAELVRGFFLLLVSLLLPPALSRFREGCVLMSLWREPVCRHVTRKKFKIALRHPRARALIASHITRMSSRKRGKADGAGSGGSPMKKPRKNPAFRRLSAEEADKLGCVSVAALRERVPKQRYDAALAAGLHTLTTHRNAPRTPTRNFFLLVEMGRRQKPRDSLRRGHRSIGRMWMGVLRCTGRPSMATRTS